MRAKETKEGEARKDLTRLGKAFILTGKEKELCKLERGQHLLLTALFALRKTTSPTNRN